MLERALHQISAAFGDGKFAERVVTALAKAEAKRDLDELDIQSLKRAQLFLASAQKMYEDQSPRITSDSVQAVVSFETTVKSLKFSGTPLEQDISEMLRISGDILDEKPVSIAEMRKTRSFFHRVLRSKIAEMDQLFSRPTRPTQRLWKPAIS